MKGLQGGASQSTIQLVNPRLKDIQRSALSTQTTLVTLSKKAKSETSRSESELVKAGRSVSVRVDPSQQ